MRPRRRIIDRLLDRCIERDGCWLFTGTTKNGYAAIAEGGRKSKVLYGHRVSYEHFRSEIPPGLDLDHLCRVTTCINPWHLEPVTRGENVRRGVAVDAVRQAHAKRWDGSQCANGHDLAVNLVVSKQANGRHTHRHCRACKRDTDRRREHINHLRRINRTNRESA